MKDLTDRHKEVVACMKMRLNKTEALTYLRHCGFIVSERTLRRDKAELNKKKFERLELAASIGFEEQHLERIDEINTIQKEMWANYNKCEDPYKRVMILKELAALQPYISGIYEVSREIVEDIKAKR